MFDSQESLVIQDTAWFTGSRLSPHLARKTEWWTMCQFQTNCFHTINLYEDQSNDSQALRLKW